MIASFIVLLYLLIERLDFLEVPEGRLKINYVA